MTVIHTCNTDEGPGWGQFLLIRLFELPTVSSSLTRGFEDFLQAAGPTSADERRCVGLVSDRCRDVGSRAECICLLTCKA